MGHASPGKGTMTPDVLFRFAAAFPKLTLVCAHWGGGLPFFTLMPEVRKALANVYFDTAASLYLYNAQIYQQVVSLLGADRILFGTDYPLLSPNRVLKEIKPLALGKEPERLILGGNAEKLLNICGCGE
jgi:predicted TIM-barrel fold metal-dependent hydrolase